MGLLAYLLLTLGVLWALQAGGTYFQMKHYRGVLRGITGQRGDGYLGVGNAKGRFRKGVILILVSDGEGVVERALMMRGRTVFARFREAPELEGYTVDELRDAADELGEKGTMLAARRAVEQIDRIRAEKREAAKKEESLEAV